MATILAIFLFFVTYAESSIITEPPRSTSALLHASASFSCEGTGSVLVWAIAHTMLTETVKQERNVTVFTSNNNGSLSSILNITALPFNNGVQIGCIIASFDPYIPVAEEVTLTVKGVSAVENIRWFHKTNKLTWSSPSFYFDGTHSATVFFYHIQLNDTNITNTTNNSIHLSISDCTEYIARITVYAGQYVSLENNKIIKIFGNNTITISNYTVTFGQIYNTVYVSLINMIRFSTQVCNSSIIGHASKLKDMKLVFPPLEIVSNESKKSVQYIMTGLEPHNMYDATIYLVNPFNVIEDQDNTTISTYHVQDLKIIASYRNGSVVIKCVLVVESTAEKCHVKFTDSTQGLWESFNITGSVNTQISLPVSGNYTVKVYDIANGLLFGPAIESPKIIEVTVLSPPSISSKHSSATAYTGAPTPIDHPDYNRAVALSNGLIVAITIATTIAIIIVIIVIVIVIQRIRKEAAERSFSVLHFGLQRQPSDTLEWVLAHENEAYENEAHENEAHENEPHDSWGSFSRFNI